MPVIPATQEAKVGGSVEPGRQRLQRAEISPWHSNLGNKSETPSQKKKKKSNKLFCSWRHGQGWGGLYPVGGLRARAEPQVNLLFPVLPCTGASLPGSESLRRGRLGGASVAVHLGKTSEDSTSFPSRALIFFTAMALVVLLRLMELEPGPEPKLEPRP